MENLNMSIRSQIKSQAALILIILSFILCEWIAMIFFIMAYSSYERVEDMLLFDNIEMAESEIGNAKRNMRIGIIVGIVCAILHTIIAVAILVAWIGLLSL